MKVQPDYVYSKPLWCCSVDVCRSSESCRRQKWPVWTTVQWTYLHSHPLVVLLPLLHTICNSSKEREKAFTSSHIRKWRGPQINKRIQKAYQGIFLARNKLCTGGQRKRQKNYCCITKGTTPTKKCLHHLVDGCTSKMTLPKLSEFDSKSASCWNQNSITGCDHLWRQAGQVQKPPCHRACYTAILHILYTLPSWAGAVLN